MPDREKVIRGLEEVSDYFFDIYRNETDSYKCEKAQEYSDVAIDAIAMLKEQEEMPFRCKTCTKHTENGFCRRWMQEVKDDDYCSFGEKM